MKPLQWMVILTLTVLAALPSQAQVKADAVHLFVPDGQLRTHAIRVFVTHDVSASMQPRLRLLAHSSSNSREVRTTEFEPLLIARNQQWIQRVEDQEIGYTGSLLLFDVSPYPMPFYKPMSRLMVALEWQENGVTHTALRDGAVNIGNKYAAVGWSVLMMIVLLVTIALMSRSSGTGVVQLFTGPSGALSLSRVQIAAWTVATGVVIFGYGLIRLELPDIPNSLIVLMGLSLATGGISHVRTGHVSPKEQQPRPGLSDLVRDTSTPSTEPHLSIARAQMLFWTGILLVLFISKTIVDGVIWDVPWEMVTLMGMSQAGYLGPKLVTGPIAPQPPETPPPPKVEP